MKILKKLKPGWGLLPILIFLILWELVARINNTPLLPPFSEVIVEFYNLIASGVLGENFLSSLTRVLIGFGAGSIVGIITGTIMGWNKIVDRALNPIFNLFSPSLLSAGYRY